MKILIFEKKVIMNLEYKSDNIFLFPNIKENLFYNIKKNKFLNNNLSIFQFIILYYIKIYKRNYLKIT